LARCASLISLIGRPVRARGVKRNSKRESSSKANVAFDFCSAFNSFRNAFAASAIVCAAAGGALLSAIGEANSIASTARAEM
jgi:hypothetical protein